MDKKVKRIKKVKKVVVPESEPVPEPEPVVSEPEPEPPVPEPEPVVSEPEPVVSEPEPVVSEPELPMKQRFDKLIKAKQDLLLELKKEIQELRKMQKDHEHLLKDALKKKKKVRREGDNTKPKKVSGFATPIVVSDELYEFLEEYNVKKTDLVARTDVTRYITRYIKEKDLQNPERRREILPDAKLLKLLGPALTQRDPSDPDSPLVYSYLKLQIYLSKHFPKKPVS